MDFREENTREFGRRLKETRKKCKITQKQLASMTGLYQVQITDYERGIRKPNEANLAKIASALDVDSNYLEFGKGEYDFAYTKYGYHIDLKYIKKYIGSDVELSPKYKGLSNIKKDIVNDLINYLSDSELI